LRSFTFSRKIAVHERKVLSAKGVNDARGKIMGTSLKTGMEKSRKFKNALQKSHWLGLREDARVENGGFARKRPFSLGEGGGA